MADERYIEIARSSEDLTRKRKESKMSKGEEKVAEALSEMRIYFEREKSFKGLYGQSGRYLLYFDFYIPSRKMCIEFDGAQHYSSEKSESEKANDYRKGMYCKKNGLSLLRIKYDQKDIKKAIEERISRIDGKQEEGPRAPRHEPKGLEDLWES